MTAITNLDVEWSRSTGGIEGTLTDSVAASNKRQLPLEETCLEGPERFTVTGMVSTESCSLLKTLQRQDGCEIARIVQM